MTDPQIIKVFLLTSDWEDKPQGHLLRFWGTSDQGPVEMTFDNVLPSFFVEQSAQLPALDIKFERKKTNLKNFHEKEMDLLQFKTQRDLWSANDILNQAKITTFEADLRTPERFLMERFIHAQMEVRGLWQKKDNYLTIHNPEVRPCEMLPQFKIASLDIETGMGDEAGLYSIAIHVMGQDIKKVFMVGVDKNNDWLSYYADEKKLLQAFLTFFQKLDPDLIIGWHVIGFDLMFLEKKCTQWGLTLDMGRNNRKVTLIEKKGSGFFADVPGRVVIDGPPALRGAFYTFENYKLETVAQTLLGEGKEINANDSEDKVSEIERRFREDKEALATYNLQDCVLVSRVFEKTGLIAMLSKRAQISGLLLDRVGMSSAAFDHCMLPRLHRKGYVAINTQDVVRSSPVEGGHVMNPKSGIYSHVVALDFKSLYPSIIRTFKIDPYSKLKAKISTLNTPGGFYFSKTEHLLPEYIEKLMIQRELAKKNKDEPLSQAIKILMNSFYGVMGAYTCRFYHPDLSGAITTLGRWLLTESQVYLEKQKGYEVLYGDTDSLFLKLQPGDYVDPVAKGQSLAKDLNQYWKERLKREFNVESFLQMDFKKHYSRFLLPLARGSLEEGAKKRYAGLVFEEGKESLDFVGLEYVRSDWTELAKKFQEEFYRRIFLEQEVEQWIRQFVDLVKNGHLNKQLIYSKRLTKEASEYTQNIPPQVKAALLLKKKVRNVQYVITLRGPIPIQLEHKDIDYDHYIQKQIRPIVDSVLPLLHQTVQSFEAIFEGTQLNLF